MYKNSFCITTNMNSQESIHKFMQSILAKEKSRVGEAARYAALNTGHLWRPTIVLKTAQAYKVPINTALPYFVGIELIHKLISHISGAFMQEDGSKH